MTNEHASPSRKYLLSRTPHRLLCPEQTISQHKVSAASKIFARHLPKGRFGEDFSSAPHLA